MQNLILHPAQALLNFAKLDSEYQQEILESAANFPYVNFSA
jgi:hypothetical protein